MLFRSPTEKNNIPKKVPTGLKKTENVLSKSKSEEDDYLKSVVKKMKDYLKIHNDEFYKRNNV